MTGSGIMTILVHKRLRDTKVKDTKFGTDVSNKKLLTLQNASVTALTVSEILRERQQGCKITLLNVIRGSREGSSLLNLEKVKIIAF